VSTLATAIATAIQQQEGYGTPQAVTLNANNNPGGLISAPGVPTVNGFAQFPSYEAGFEATVALVQSKIDAGMTLSQLTSVWAPAGAPNDPTGVNNPSAYASFLSQQTGLPLNTPLNSLETTTPATTLDISSTDSILSDLGLTSDSGDTAASTLPDPTTIVLIGLAGLLLWAIFKDA